MALRAYYIGGAGPYYYDDAAQQNDDPDSSDSPIDPWSDDTPVVGHEYNPADTSPVRSIRSEMAMRQDETPSGLVGEDVVNVNYVLSNIIRFVSVADIDNPNLSSYSGNGASGLLLARGVSSNEDSFTLYSWDATVGTGANSPYVVTGSGGFWIAIAGKYINGKQILRRDLVLAVGSKLFLGVLETSYLEIVSSSRVDLFVNSNRVAKFTA